MKVTIDWLKKYTAFNYTADELAHNLTMLGMEVDAVSKISYDFENVVIGEIQHIKKHEERPNLSICSVNTGNEVIELVCGAPNVVTGIKVAVALPGAKLPGNINVETATIHGYKSFGMICSEAELNLSNQSDIIMVLNNHASTGTDLKTYLGEPDTVIELDVSPNRPDCLSVIGIARELSTLNQTKVVKPKIQIKESAKFRCEDFFQVEIKNPESCPRYTARYIHGIKVGPSPRWLIEKLEAVGFRTINNVVDITNFVMLETGQPLHAFDYDLLEAQKIIIKHASPGEKFITLDEKEHTLNSEKLMICDGNKSIALAGVMGGLNSEITPDTKNVLLESAYFNPLNIRKTSKALDISTDSSKRFERGVDPEGLIYALDRAAQLINELAEGEIAKGIVDCYPQKIKTNSVYLSEDRVNHLLGTSLQLDEIIDILARLELHSRREDEKIVVEVPTFRVDIEREVDLIEEVSRIYGFDKIKVKENSLIPLNFHSNKKEKFTQLVRDFIIKLGYNEILTHSMISYDQALLFSDHLPIKIKNPLSEDMETLRTSLLPGALQVLRWNKNRRIHNQKLFELGNIFFYSDDKATVHHEFKKIAFFRMGQFLPASWIDKSRSITFFDIKGDVFAFLQQLGMTEIKLTSANEKFLDQNEAISLTLDNQQIGYLGCLSKEILNHLDIEEKVYLAEIDFDMLFDHFLWEKKALTIIKYPAIKRDLAIVVDQFTPSQKIESLIIQTGGELLRSVELFDVYRGKQIDSDKKSFAFTMTFQSNERTLTETEVDTEINNILQALKVNANASLRS